MKGLDVWEAHLPAIFIQLNSKKTRLKGSIWDSRIESLQKIFWKVLYETSVHIVFAGVQVRNLNWDYDFTIESERYPVWLKALNITFCSIEAKHAKVENKLEWNKREETIFEIFQTL